MDIDIAHKALKFPLIGEKVAGKWNLHLRREFNVTDDAALFHKKQLKNTLPLYEGKMIHQFTHAWSGPRYWVLENEGRRAFLSQNELDEGQILNYQVYRLAYRDIARSTDSRTMIATVIPPTVFSVNTLVVSHMFQALDELLFVTSAFNSFVFDYLIRQKVSAHCNMFYVYQVPVPRLTEDGSEFAPIVERAARLVCTTPEFDDLAREVGLKDHTAGATDPQERARLRAELDGMIAHLYGLTEDEFAYILSTFPLVEQSVKDAVLEQFRRFASAPDDRAGGRKAVADQ